MAIKSTPVKKPESSYPVIKQYTDIKTTYCVLFTSHRTGMVVNSDDEIYSTGEYSDSWLESSFTPFNGKITLENE